MPTTTDPASWLSALINSYWDQAKESLRAQGANVTLDACTAYPAWDPRSGGKVNSLVKIKIYQETSEATSMVTQGDRDLDSRSSWVAQITAEAKNGEARQRCHEAGLIIQRVLQLYRRNPHPDWHGIDDVRIQHLEDFFDYQRRLVQFRLSRYGEVLPDPILQVTT